MHQWRTSNDFQLLKKHNLAIFLVSLCSPDISWYPCGEWWFFIFFHSHSLTESWIRWIWQKTAMPLICLMPSRRTSTCDSAMFACQIGDRRSGWFFSTWPAGKSRSKWRISWEHHLWMVYFPTSRVWLPEWIDLEAEHFKVEPNTKDAMIAQSILWSIIIFRWTSPNHHSWGYTIFRHPKG
jgi:hypothetical protein